MNVLPILYGVGFILIVLGLICVIVWKLKQKYKLNVPLAIWNGIAMLPILFSPLVFLGSVFIFDNPSSIIGAIILFFLVNSYSIILFLGSVWSAKLWVKGYKVLAWGIPCTLNLLVYGLILTLIL